MMLQEQIYAQALLLAGELDGHQADLLKVLCASSAAALRSRLKDGITPEDCLADFICAAGLYALSALNDAGASSAVAEFKAGDLTVKSGSRSDAASRCLERQAQFLMGPYLKDHLVFQRV